MSKQGREFTFQERLIWALLGILTLNFVGWWLSAFLGVELAGGPDPSLVVSGFIGLIGAIWGSGEVISAVRKRIDAKPPVDTKSEEGE